MNETEAYLYVSSTSFATSSFPTAFFLAQVPETVTNKQHISYHIFTLLQCFECSDIIFQENEVYKTRRMQHPSSS